MNDHKRVLLMADLTSLNAEEDKLLLHAYGYDAVNYYDLTLPAYRHNDGQVPTDRQLRDNVVVELLQGALIVLHPDLDTRTQVWLAKLSEVMDTPLVPMADLAMQADDMTQERIDAANVAGALLTKATPAGAVHDVPRIDMAHAHLVDPTYAEPLMDTPAPVRTMRVAHSKHRPKVSLLQRALRGVQQAVGVADRLLGDSMKNPMVREQQRKEPYRLDTTPVSTTG